MKPSIYRRMRRRTASHEAANANLESKQEQSFFGEALHETFFQPSPVVQRKCEKCGEEDKKVQKKESSVSAASSAGVNSYVASLNGRGQSLSADTNQYFSSRMGYDFSDVKIHNDQEAVQSAIKVNAKAYTVGEHVVFNEGQFNTESEEGKKLMAHELTHVMQNKPEADNKTLQRQTSTPVPSTATVDPDTHVATFAIDSVNVVVEPDQTLTRGTAVTFHGQRHTVNQSGALTVSYLQPRLVPSYTGSGRRRRVSSIAISFTLYIKTYFGTRASASDTSAYGRGTTADDMAAGYSSLGFHEGRHGQDYQDYIAQNPLPQITLTVPASISDYNTAVRLFNGEMRTYSAAMSEYSHTNTDMVGTPEP